MKLLSVADYARLEGVSPTTVHRRIESGRIDPAFVSTRPGRGRSGAEYRINPAALSGEGMTALSADESTTPSVAKMTSEQATENWNRITDRARAEAMRKAEGVRFVDDLLATMPMEDALTVARRRGVWQWSAKSFYNWRALAEQALAEGADPAKYLVDGRAQAAKNRDIEKQIDYEQIKRFWLTPAKPSKKGAYKKAKAAIKSTFGRELSLSYRQAARDLARIPEEVRVFHRLGEKAWRDRFAPWMDRDYTDLAVNELWNSDHHQMDVPCKGENGKPAFPWLTIWQDVRSRLIVGAVLSFNPNSSTIMQAFVRGTKNFGLPLHVYMDNGKDYRSRRIIGGRPTPAEKKKVGVKKTLLQGAFVALDMGIHFAEVYHGQSKPAEPWFGSMEMIFGRGFLEYRGTDPKNRNATCDEMLKRGEVMELSELADLLLGNDEEIGYINAWNVTAEHSGHGMGGKSPWEVFKAGWTEIRKPSDVALDACLRERKSYKVRRHCLWVKVAGESLRFSAPFLFDYEGQDVVVGIDDRDLRYAAVWDGRGRYLGRAEVATKAKWLDRFDREMLRKQHAEKKDRLEALKNAQKAYLAEINEPSVIQALGMDEVDKSDFDVAAARPDVVAPVRTPFDRANPRKKLAANDVPPPEGPADRKKRTWADMPDPGIE